MTRSMKALAGVFAIAAVGVIVSGCGTEVEINAPLLDAAGLNVKEALMGKKAPEPNLQERAPLVLPPPNAGLPVPGQGTQASLGNDSRWPVDPEIAKKQAAKDAADKHDEYCRNGNWNSDKGNIDTFNKNTGQDTRCRPSWIYRALHGGEDEANAEKKQ